MPKSAETVATRVNNASTWSLHALSRTSTHGLSVIIQTREIRHTGVLLNPAKETAKESSTGSRPSMYCTISINSNAIQDLLADKNQKIKKSE